MDKKRFIIALDLLAANWGKQYGEKTVGLWYKMAVKRDLTADQIEKAVGRLIEENMGYTLPVWGDVLDAIGQGPEKLIELKAATEADGVLKAVSVFGSYTTPKFDDPITARLMRSRWSWGAVCRMTEGELKWWRKDFVAAYQEQTEIEDARPMLEGTPGNIKGLLSGIGG